MNICVLLTAAMHVSKRMPSSHLNNLQERVRDFDKAFSWWHETTPFKLVVSETTGYPLELPDDVELYSMDMNVPTFDYCRGKGWAEAVCMDVAYKRSRFLAQSDIHVKCSGRYYVANVGGLVDKLLKNDAMIVLPPRSRKRSRDSVILDMFHDDTWVPSYCFVYAAEFYRKYLSKWLLTVDQRQRYGCMEHILAKAVADAKAAGERIVYAPYQVVGRSGCHTYIP